MNSEYINLILEEEIKFSDSLAYKYRYPDNITHLLYLIIPAFIIKYGNNYKYLIEKTFMEVPIRINDKQDNVYQAYYYSIPEYKDGVIITTKGIVLQNYNNISLMQLLENLVHEYNHAINSIKNEIIIDNDIKIRTGISYNYFNNNLAFIKKSDTITLEEVINTKQTESIINIIRDFKNYNIQDINISNTLYSINHSVGLGYKSNSYLLESIVCRKLMENKTFIATFEKLRFEGQVDDLPIWFDNITGINGSFYKLTSLLSKILNLSQELSITKWFKNMKINKIRALTSEALEIVENFNNNTIYK